MLTQQSRSAAYTVAKQRVLAWLLGVAWPLLAILGGVILVVAAFTAYAYSVSPASGSTGDIPTEMMALYQSDLVKRECPTLSWTVVAAIGKIETDHGRNVAESSAGAQGPMQFMPTTWDKPGLLVVNVGLPYGRVPDGEGYGVDGSGDGLANIMEPYDAVPATARFLCANGGGNEKTLPQAIFQYNHSWAYVEDVLSQAKEYELGSAGSGAVIIDPGANLPGQPIQPETMAFLERVAGIYGKPIHCSTGTNHREFTVDGNISDHYSGNACDFGMAANGGTDDSPIGDAIDTACLIATGIDSTTAAQIAYIGGLKTVSNVPSQFGLLRVQCIWKTYEGGNHHTHVHIGARLQG